MGNCCDSHKAASCRPRNGCHSFEWRGIWKLGAYYFNDDYVTDFISYKNTILACRRNHMSDVNTEPELIYDEGVPVNVSPPNWSFVLYAGSGGDLSNLTFRLNNNILSYSIDGGSTFTEIGEFSFTESDPIYSSSVAASITTQDINNWNSKTSNIGTVTAVKVNNTTYNPTSGVVDLGTIGGGGASQLNDLSDVTLSSPSSGNQLVYDGSKWINGAVGNMNYMKVTSAQYASMQQGGTLQSNILYIIVD